MWHVSIGRDGLDVSQWTRQQAKAADRLAKDLLGGVGTGETFLGWGRLAFHARRRLSDAEVARLSAEWLATPAVDVAGELRARRV